MANQLDPMDIKQIITLHIDGSSNREIGEMLGISRNTVNTYVKLVKVCDHRFEDLLAMDNAALHDLFAGRTTIKNPRFNELIVNSDDVDHRYCDIDHLHHRSIFC
jgi:hypothetical protein